MNVATKTAAEAAYVAKGKASYDSHEWKEARDAHGRWIKGFSEMKSVADGLLASGKITKAQHVMVMQASARHASMGRGIPLAAQHDPAKMLDWLAGTMRQDVKDANAKEPGGAEAKVLGRTARAVENVAAAAHGKAREGRAEPIVHPPVHPDDIGATLGGVKVVKKASEPSVTPSKTQPATGDSSGLKVVSKAGDAPYQVGDRVKRNRSVTAPGTPVGTREWAPGTVEKVTPLPEHGLYDITVRHDDGTIGVERVGPKGGNKNIRRLSDGAEPKSASLRDQQKDVKLPADAHRALKNYVTGAADGIAGKASGKGWGSRTISKRLRSATPLSGPQQKYVDDLDSAFNSVPATEKELTLHRGISTSSKSAMSLLPKDLKVGDTFGDKGYMSTSTSSKAAEDFTNAQGDVLHLTLPAGAHPIDVNAHIKGAYGDEREVLLPRGAQIRVTAVKDRVTKRPGPDGMEEVHGRTIHGELILPDAPKDLPSDTDHEVDTDEPQNDAGEGGYAVAPAVEPLAKNDFDVGHIQDYKAGAIQAATEFANQSFDKSSMTGADEKAIGDYSQGESNVINPFLRTGKHTKQASWPSEETPDGLRAKTKALDAAIAKSTTKQNIVVYRGVSDKFMGDAKPGDEITDKGFVSTAQTPHVASSGAWMHSSGAHVVEIRVPKGSHAASINQLDDHIHAVQGEVLLPRDSVFRVIGTGDHPILELVPKASAPDDADHPDGVAFDKGDVKPLSGMPLDKTGLRNLRADWTSKFRKMKAGESIDTLNGGKVSYEGNDVWALHDENGKVVKRHVYATRVARDMLARNGIGVGSHVGEPAHSTGNVEPDSGIFDAAQHTDPIAALSKRLDTLKVGEKLVVNNGTHGNLRIRLDGFDATEDHERRYSVRGHGGNGSMVYGSDKAAAKAFSNVTMIPVKPRGGPTVVKKASEVATLKPGPRVVRKAKAASQSVLDKIKGPKIVKKMQTVKVSADQLRPGDIVTDGRIRFGTTDKPMHDIYSGSDGRTIPHQRTVLSVRKRTDEEANPGKMEIKLSAPLNVPDDAGPLYIAKKYGNNVPNEEIERTASPTSVSTVKREVSVTKATGSKITLDKAPTTKEFKAALDDAMQNATSPDAIAHLDPSHRPMPKGQRAGHAQQLLYDLAVGHLNGVTRSKAVKSDDDYRQELNAGSITKPIPDDVVEKHIQTAIGLLPQDEQATYHEYWKTEKEQGNHPTLGDAATILMKSMVSPQFRSDFQKQQDKYIEDSAKVPDDVAESHMLEAISKNNTLPGGGVLTAWNAFKQANGGDIEATAKDFLASNPKFKPDYDKLHDAYVAEHSLRSKGALDLAREEADRQTPHVFKVSRKQGQGVKLIDGKIGPEEPAWKDEYTGDLPKKDAYSPNVTIQSDQSGLHAVPSTVSDEELKKTLMAQRDHNGMSSFRSDWHVAHPNSAFRDFVNSPELASHLESLHPGWKSTELKLTKETRTAVAKERADRAEKEMIDERRGIEGTAKYDSGLPTWTEDGKLEPQSFSDIDKRQKGTTLPGADPDERIYPLALVAADDMSKSTPEAGSVSILSSPEQDRIERDAKIRMGANPDLKMGDAYRASIDQAHTPEGLDVAANPGNLLISDEQHAALHAALDAAEKSWKDKHPDQVMRDYVPTFHTQGLVEDGVLYHRQEDASLDPDKLRKALTQGIKQAAKSVEGQTEADPLRNGELRDSVQQSGASVPYSMRQSLGLHSEGSDGPTPQSDARPVYGTRDDLHKLVNADWGTQLSGDDRDKLHGAIDTSFDKAEGRTRAKQLPQVDLDAIIRAATSDYSEKGWAGSARAVLDAGLSRYNNSVDGFRLSPEQHEQLGKSLDIVQKRMEGATTPHTHGSVPQDADNEMIKAMENAGAVITTNSQWQKNTGTWFKTTPGDMLLLQEGASLRPLTDEEKVKHTKQALPQLQNGTLTYKGMDAQASQAISDMNDAHEQYKAAQTIGGMREAQEAHSEAVERYASRTEAIADEKPSAYKQSYLKSAKRARTKYGSDAKFKRATTAADKAQHVEAEDGDNAKRIEYVPWRQGGKDSANGPGYRSMKGSLRMEGYTPEEATAKLKELGIVGDLETHIPGQAIFRSARRTGDVAPLHSAYVRGESQPPNMPFLLTHGLTDSKAGDSVNAFQNIAYSGGLLSISDRFQRGIHTSTSSQAGDIGSGVDHVVFCAMNGGGTCGSGSPIRIGLRPDTAMRRDVAISPLDFGGGSDRYGRYKAFRDAMEAEAGKEVGGTSLYTPLDPAARQLQLDKYELGRTKGFGSVPDGHSWSGSAEFDMAHQVRVEDMQVVSAKDQPTADKIQKHLEILLAAGHVSRIPDVILARDWDKHIFLK